MDQGLGERFARAVTRRDRVALQDVLAPEIDFLGLTPGRLWEATTATTLMDDVILGVWLESSDDILALESVQAGCVGDRESVTYRFRVTNPDGHFLVEQHAYFGVENDRINWLRVMCSGFRPLGPAQ